MKTLSVYNPKLKKFLIDFKLSGIFWMGDEFEKNPESIFSLKRVRTWKRLSDLTSSMSHLKKIDHGEKIRNYLLENCVVIEVIVRDRRDRGLKASVIELDINRFIK